MISEKRLIGNEVEAKAAAFLERAGLKMLEQNYSCKMGEIDLIMQDQDYYVFVEVRYRKKEDFGDGVESVGKAKRSKVIRAAKYYLLERNLYDKVPCRFDVIAANDENICGKMVWIKDAFWVKWR